MLSTDLLSLVASLVALVAALYAVWHSRVAFGAAADAYAAADRRAPGLKHVAEMQSELTELKDAYDALLKSHKKLRSRIGMRANREEKADQDDAMPAATDPQWKQKARVALAKAGKLNAKFHTS